MKTSTPELEKLFLIAWGMWYKRNQKVHEDKDLFLERVVECALSLQKDHKEFQGRQKHMSHLQCYWAPPPSGAMKLNVDGAVFHDQCRAGVGIILRDAKGEVVMAASKKENEVKDPTEIELLAMFRGLQLCIPMGLQELLVESDSLLMVKEIQISGESL